MDLIFDNIQSPKLLVIGEIILDINIIGSYESNFNMSQKQP